MMKKTAFVILTVCSMLVFGQKVSDYKYISLPVKFSTFKEDFGLGDLLAKTLRSKNYMVIPADKLQWPPEAQANPCNVLIADVINDSGFLRNKILLQFKDCNDKVVSSVKGASNIKEYKEGYQDALKQTFVSVSPASPVSHTDNSSNIASRTAVPAAKETGTELNSKTTDENNAVKFSYGKYEFNKIQIDQNQFILVDQNSSSPFATFKATSKADVFRVKLQNGESTIGYYENGNIVIEMSLSKDIYSKEIFTKK